MTNYKLSNVMPHLAVLKTLSPMVIVKLGSCRSKEFPVSTRFSALKLNNFNLQIPEEDAVVVASIFL